MAKIFCLLPVDAEFDSRREQTKHRLSHVEVWDSFSQTLPFPCYFLSGPALVHVCVFLSPVVQGKFFPAAGEGVGSAKN